MKLALTVMAVALLAVACSASPSSSGSPSSAGTGGASSAYVADALAFARCVRVHGVPNFPDPDSTGVFPKSVLGQLGVSASRLRAAQAPCSHLLPSGTPPLTAEDQRDYLRAAICMRSHGIVGFPDPAFSGGTVSFPVPSSINAHSTQFTRARQTCAKLIPAGLPYSGSGG